MAAVVKARALAWPLGGMFPGCDGSERSGWPVDVSVQGGNQFPSVSIAVGDFNRDGHEEIVLSREAAIYLFNSDGTLFPGGWPLTANIIG